MNVRSEREAATALRARLETLRADPALRGHVLLAELERLAEDHLHLLRRMEKITRISDTFQGQLKELNESLQELSSTDFLTGLSNRRAIMEAVAAEHGRALRSQEPLTLLLCDIDHFKAVNDTYGHAAGDEVLRALARAMRETLRRYDACGRWGGEEFLVVLPGTSAAGAQEAAEKLRRVASRLEVEAGDTRIPVTLSVGVAQLEEGESLDSLLRRADAAMYEAKRAGRDRITLDQKR